MNTMMQNKNKYLKNIDLARKRKRIMEYLRFQDDFSLLCFDKEKTFTMGHFNVFVVNPW